MRFDFTSLMDRRGMDAIAVDQLPVPFGEDKGAARVDKGFSRIPMWVADMNFPVVPSVIQALVARAEHPAFGYFYPRDSYYEAIVRWQETQHGVTGLSRENIGYENGVLGGVISALRAVCSRGDSVLLHSPTYVGFTAVLENNGFHSVHSPLKLDEKGVWRMDFADMEAKIQKFHIHGVILCSPHNPCGRVWEEWELARAMEIFRDNGVYVISDEIWSDLTLEGYHHIPTQSVSQDARMRTMALYAPSKTFNLAGLVGSYHIIYDPWLRDRVLKEASLSRYNEMNVLSMHGLLGAYTQEGALWLAELRQVLTRNVEYACDYIETHFPGVFVARPQGTYMLFLDCGAWCESHGKTMDELVEAGIRVGVIWQDGRPFFGSSHIRVNLAVPFSLVQEAMERLREHVFCI
ncbi:MAG: aminotransferase class I/II-fold pyridoxal phosphate-dependent enzyme [Lachnospiraceae bacterium]|nr:aminotransferase class I/II-fold pyridoxal phosphate-dependent enzyme [Lachnospiraceae bacterium]